MYKSRAFRYASDRLDFDVLIMYNAFNNVFCQLRPTIESCAIVNAAEEELEEVRILVFEKKVSFSNEFIVKYEYQGFM